jgi:chromosome segregation ATPase
MSHDAIKNQVEEIHENHMEAEATVEYTEVYNELQELLAQDSPDLDELQQALSDYVDAARAIGTTLTPTRSSTGLESGEPEPESWETDLEALELQIDELGKPDLADFDEIDHEVEADAEPDLTHGF